MSIYNVVEFHLIVKDVFVICDNIIIIEELICCDVINYINYVIN